MVALFVSLLSPWTITIEPAHQRQTFGFGTPACWLAVAGLLAALLLAPRRAAVAIVFTEVVLAAWFGWATWVVTTPRFADLPFPFMGTDLIGPGWYAAAIGLLSAAGAVVGELRRRDAPVREDLWLLTAIPGFGLMRLGHWLGGGAWAGFFVLAFYLASTDSPDPAVFIDYGPHNVPPPYPRGAEWVLLAVAAVLFVASVGVTVRTRRKLQTRSDSD